MQLILLQKVDNLGNLGEIVNVRAGYARNYLLPKGLCKVATDDNKKEFEERRVELEKLAADQLSAAQARADKISALTVNIQANSGTEGKLFGSLGPQDISQAVTEAGVEVSRREVRLPEGPLRTAGEHQVTLHLHSDVDAVVTINVEGIE